jgi:Cu+-exporting ATPase
VGIEALQLPIGGMSCASCAARVERQLNRLDGVTATVNYATEHAAVEYDTECVRPEALVNAVEQAGYAAHLPAPESAADLRRRLLVASALTAPVLLLAMIPPLRFTFWEWVCLLPASVVVLWAGRQFHLAAWRNLRHRAATMDTLVSLSTLSAWGWSVVAVAAGSDETYLEVASVVVTYVLAGRYFEARAKRNAGAALRSLAEVGAKEAVLVDANGGERLIPIELLAVGDIFVVRPGERLAADGVVVEGRSAVDRSVLTGESVPVEVAPGDEVAGATVNLGGRLVVRAERVGAETALAQIARIVRDAQSGKAPVQRLADRIAAVFVPIVLVLAAATLGFWLARGAGAGFAFSAAVAVLIVACPCALGLATPTALLVGTGRGAQLGILIRGPEVLESTRRVDTIVLDKTGTVTEGAMTLVDVVPSGTVERDEALRLVGALAHASEHPVARAIATAALRNGTLPRVASFESRDGLGIRGTVDGLEIVIGRPSLLAQHGVLLGGATASAVAAAQAEGKTAVAAAWQGEARALFVVADAVKPTSREAVAELKGLGLRPVLVTGDSEAAARSVAREIGVDDVIADVLPVDKAAAVELLQRSGAVVAVVGDGVNDAPALARADLGLAIGTGTDVAIEASDLTLVSGDLRVAADAIRLSRRTLGTIKGNLFWAFAYNVAALPLAAAGYLNPLIAGAAMACSSLFVVSNSLRLRGFKPYRR